MNGETHNGLFDAQRVRSVSTTPAPILATQGQSREHQRVTLLSVVKEVCDRDLRTFIEEHEGPNKCDSAPPGGEIAEALRCVRALLNCKGKELSDGTFAAYLGELRVIQQRVQHVEGNVPESAALTRLLLSASRVTRMAEFTSFREHQDTVSLNTTNVKRTDVASVKIQCRDSRSGSKEGAEFGFNAQSAIFASPTGQKQVVGSAPPKRYSFMPGAVNVNYEKQTIVPITVQIEEEKEAAVHSPTSSSSSLTPSPQTSPSSSPTSSLTSESSSSPSSSSSITSSLSTSSSSTSASSSPSPYASPPSSVPSSSASSYTSPPSSVPSSSASSYSSPSSSSSSSSSLNETLEPVDSNQSHIVISSAEVESPRAKMEEKRVVQHMPPKPVSLSRNNSLNKSVGSSSLTHSVTSGSGKRFKKSERPSAGSATGETVSGTPDGKKNDPSIMSHLISKVKGLITSSNPKIKKKKKHHKRKSSKKKTAAPEGEKKTNVVTVSVPQTASQMSSKTTSESVVKVPVTASKKTRNKSDSMNLHKPQPVDTRCSLDGVPSHITINLSDGSLNSGASKGRGKVVICRICEQQILSTEIDEHAKMCAQRSVVLSKIAPVRTSLVRACSVLEKKLLDTLQVMQSQDTQVTQPLHPNTIAFLTSLLSAVPEYVSGTADKNETAFYNSLQMNIEPLVQSSLFQKSAQEVLKLLLELNTLATELKNIFPRDTSQLGTITTGARIDDFDFLRSISKGAFGSVYLARKKKTGDLYAIKRLNKRQAVMKNQVAHIMAERNILASTNSPFLIRSYYSFQTQDNLYLVMEYAPGGDLYSLLRQLGCLSEDVAQVYVAQIVLALEYLHGLGIVHRDLKPDNLLISADGHLKLTDFGLSRYGLIDDPQGQDTAVFNSMFMSPDMQEAMSSMQTLKRCPSPNPVQKETVANNDTQANSSEQQQDPNTLPSTSQSTQETSSTPSTPDMAKTNTMRKAKRGSYSNRQRHSFVGTPDYLAPEVILGTGHDRSVDWWAVGVICYEILTGVPPFNDDSPDKIFEHILDRNIMWPQVPDEMSAAAFDFIDKLLRLDPTKRLGARGDIEEVKRHPFFEGIDWNGLQNPETAVFVPQLDGDEDLSYFDQENRRASLTSVNNDILAVRSKAIYAIATKIEGKEDSEGSESGSGMLHTNSEVEAQLPPTIKKNGLQVVNVCDPKVLPREPIGVISSVSNPAAKWYLPPHQNDVVALPRNEILNPTQVTKFNLNVIPQNTSGLVPSPRKDTQGFAVPTVGTVEGCGLSCPDPGDSSSSMSDSDSSEKELSLGSVPPQMDTYPKGPRAFKQPVTPDESSAAKQEAYFRDFSYKNLPNLNLLTLQKLQTTGKTPDTNEDESDLFTTTMKGSNDEVDDIEDDIVVSDDGQADAVLEDSVNDDDSEIDDVDNSSGQNQELNGSGSGKCGMGLTPPATRFH